MPSIKENNVLFPDKIIITDTTVTFYKGNLIGYKYSTIKRCRISSIIVCHGLLFSEIMIESIGGGRITARGFRHSDTNEIIQLLN